MKYFVSIIGLIAGLTSLGQSVNYLTPEQAVEILLGDGIVATNITYAGSAVQIGEIAGFDGSGFPIGDGVILSSADVVNVLPPGNFNEVPFGEGISGDADLLTVANSVPPLIGQFFSVGSVNDMSILEFDFTPTGDSLSFSYSFGSDEYLAWVNSSFNDVFAFFLSGPGITGPYDSPPGFPDGAINIAFLPDSDPELPITISSVNNVLNTEYYIDNPNNIGFAINGYTVTLQALAQVQCGETYHIKLAIADGSDTALESIVVLEAGSFSSNALNIVGGVNNAPEFLPGNTVLEGCVDGYFTIFQPNINVADTLSLIVSGTATSGIDFEPFPATVIIPEGSVSIDLTLIPLYDDLDEGTESITIQYFYLNSCGDADTATATMFIQNYNFMSLDFEDVFICPGAVTVVSAVPDGGVPNFSYTWSSGQSSANVTFDDQDVDDSAEISVSVTDYCQNSVSDSFILTEPAPFEVQDSVDFCLGLETGDMVLGGASPYEYEYDTLALAYLGNDKFTALLPGIYYIDVNDQCGQSETIYVEVVECDTFIPNVFTPEGSNDHNQFFVIQGIEGFPKSKLMVYNRWGNLVYESEKYDNKWRGDDVPAGTYFYIFNRSDGENFSGHITILKK
ncbi:MAG: choice-of-anchor L domain-containing protein [Flavobacteriales bacterium]|nr:choice-of-anchor L domain-containing protein [Flavobacteriales bacterium]